MKADAVNGSPGKGWKYRGVIKRLRGSGEYDV